MREAKSASLTKGVNLAIRPDIPNFGNTRFGDVDDRLSVGQERHAVPALIHFRGAQSRLPPRGNVPRLETVFLSPNQPSGVSINYCGKTSASLKFENSFHSHWQVLGNLP